MNTIVIHKILSWVQKLFFVILPWQTMYIIVQAPLPIESIVIHLSALIMFGSLCLAFFVYKPKITWKHLIVCGVVVCVNLYGAPNNDLAIQQILWLGLAGGWVWLLSKNNLTRKELVVWLSLGAIVPAGLGLYQFFNQSSVTNSWLGLSYIPASMAGSPVIVTETGRWLRAFGSFPHPNMFGGYLVGVIVLIIFEIHQSSKKTRWLWYSVIGLLTSVLILTFSRSAVLLWGLYMVYFHYRIFTSRQLSELAIPVFISTAVAICMIGSTWSIWSGRLGQGTLSANESVAIHERLDGTVAAIKTIREYPWLGVGAGNYTTHVVKVSPELKPWEISPVHNVPLLVMAEWGVLLGLLGLLMFARLVGFWGLLWTPILLFDHYLYSQWPGVLVGVILILSTVYAHRCSTEPKK